MLDLYPIVSNERWPTLKCGWKHPCATNYQYFFCCIDCVKNHRSMFAVGESTRIASALPTFVGATSYCNVRYYIDKITSHNRKNAQWLVVQLLYLIEPMMYVRGVSVAFLPILFDLLMSLHNDPLFTTPGT